MRAAGARRMGAIPTLPPGPARFRDANTSAMQTLDAFRALRRGPRGSARNAEVRPAAHRPLSHLVLARFDYPLRDLFA